MMNVEMSLFGVVEMEMDSMLEFKTTARTGQDTYTSRSSNSIQRPMPQPHGK
jgi:hypothetical protein